MINIQMIKYTDDIYTDDKYTDDKFTDDKIYRW